jgi:hypothetical protein
MTETHPNTSRSPLPQFEIVLPAGMHDAIREFLFRDSSREYMGVILAGVSETGRKVKLLGRRFIPVATNDYEHQSAGGLAVRGEYSQRLLRQCADEGLSQIDVHSHPFGPSPDLWFSGTDNSHERRMAEYIYGKLDGSLYASLVMNQAEVGERRVQSGRNTLARMVNFVASLSMPARLRAVLYGAPHRMRCD